MTRFDACSLPFSAYNFFTHLTGSIHSTLTPSIGSTNTLDFPDAVTMDD